MSEVDLSGLRLDESAVIPRRPFGPRLMVAGLVLLVVAVAATFLWPLLMPARAVRMVKVRAVQHGGAISSTAVTEAVGWVEADPFPHVVRPLVRGRIETLEVLEGAEVIAGETVVAKLVSAELQAARDRAQAMVAEREAALVAARADRDLAQRRLRQNAEAKLRVTEATTRLTAIETRLATATERAEQAVASAASARAVATAQERLAKAGTSYPVALERARAEADAAEASAKAAGEEMVGLRGERAAQSATLALCTELAEDPVDLRGAVDVAEAAVGQARAAVAKARTELSIAERELAWATVRSPVSGVVMRLEAGPGDSVGPGQLGIVALYDPAKLRARIDVPLDSLAGIHADQKVEITSEAIGKVVVHGVVQRLQHETDLLKNTLQVKIGLVDPPPLLRPETLCRARFLASPSVSDGAGARQIAAFVVPAEAIRDGRVFVWDPASGVVRGRAIEVVGEHEGGQIVRGDLSPTQHLVLDSVAEGESVKGFER